jgi:uncharacterized protein
MISIKAAKKAIDFIFANAIDLSSKDVGVGFHGGGEPLMFSNKTFIEEAIEYTKLKAKEFGVRYNFTAATNGIDITKFSAIWLKNNFSRISVSLDGTADIQNHQRPRRGSDKDSYKRTLNAIQLLDKYNIDYGIRATITKESVNRMSEIVEHFTKISSQKSFHLEPLFECGRCKTSKLESPTQSDFIDNYKKAAETAKRLGVEIFYSGASIRKMSDRFCGAAGDNFFITPDSYVTTCLEACRVDDIDNEPFVIGKYNDEFDQYDFDQKKINLLKSRKVANMKSCNDCLCKFSCAGDCLAKVLKNTGDMFDATNNRRCKINVALTEFMIKEYLV